MISLTSGPSNKNTSTGPASYIAVKKFFIGWIYHLFTRFSKKVKQYAARVRAAG